VDDRYATFCRGAFEVHVRLIAPFANKTEHAIDPRVDKGSGTFPIVLLFCMDWEEDAIGNANSGSHNAGQPR
jgi:hypothetical protein